MPAGKMEMVYKAPAKKYVLKKKKTKSAGTVLPKSDKILDSKVDSSLKKNTMYAPSKNMMRAKIGSMFQNIGPFGTRWAGRLKYVDRFNQANALGVYSEVLFNLNSVYDPDRTGSGHQPLGFDNLAAIFSRYRVLKTTWKITGTNLEQNQNLSIVAYISNSVSSVSSVSDALEEGYSTFKMRNAFIQPSIMQGRVNLHTLTGNSLVAYRSDDKYEGTTSSNPTELLILHIGTEGSASVNSIFSYHLELEFDVEFWDPIQLGPS